MLKVEARKLALFNRRTKNSKESSEIVLDKIINCGILIEYENIGIYYPIGSEINIIKLINKYPNKSFYLPITNDEISFIKYNIGDTLYKGLFNTMEPKGDVVDRDLIDCYIIPCVAISKENKRLGYGKGYYDRYLSGYTGLKIGICYNDSYMLDFDTDSFDIKLDIVFTDWFKDGWNDDKCYIINGW